MRLLHTMIRVGDLDRSIGFYTEVLGMKLLRRKDYPDGKFTLAFVGYGDESETAVIELTHNWETKSYDLGNGFGHIARRALRVGTGHAAAFQGGGRLRGEDAAAYHSCGQRCAAQSDTPHTPVAFRQRKLGSG